MSKIFVFTRNKEITPCGNSHHIYVPKALKNAKIAGVIVVDDNESLVYEHSTMKKCSECSMISMLSCRSEHYDKKKKGKK